MKTFLVEIKLNDLEMDLPGCQRVFCVEEVEANDLNEAKETAYHQFVNRCMFAAIERKRLNNLGLTPYCFQVGDVIEV
jgi:hypothetical protein